MKRRTVLKLTLILLFIYIGIVVIFESSLGYFQPEAGNTVVITTFESDGVAHERVVSLLSSNDQLYVAVNHWPRAWYRRLLRNSSMQMSREGVNNDYVGVVVGDMEFDQVQLDNPVPLFFRFLTGFPPRYFVRLDPI